MEVWNLDPSSSGILDYFCLEKKDVAAVVGWDVAAAEGVVAVDDVAVGGDAVVVVVEVDDAVAVGADDAAVVGAGGAVAVEEDDAAVVEDGVAEAVGNDAWVV